MQQKYNAYKQITLSAKTNRGCYWSNFALEVLNHIESYTVAQYGDFPTDQLTKWTVDDIVTAIKKYVNRAGNNARGFDEEKRDCLKIAHYAQELYDRREAESEVDGSVPADDEPEEVSENESNCVTLGEAKQDIFGDIALGIKHKFRLILPNNKHDLAVVLWDSAKAYREKISPNRISIAKFLAATPSTGRNYTRLGPQSLGSLHFLSGCWNINVVGHEFFHVIMHIMRLQKKFGKVMDKNQVEDAFAMLFGQSLDYITKELWEHDPPKDGNLNNAGTCPETGEC